MIVEDDKLVRKNLVHTLNWQQFDMQVVGDAKNGEKALEQLQETEVDLIITDLAMPIMSGIELIRQVKELYPKVFIVVLSLHRDFEYIQEAMRLGAIDYIAKVELDDQSLDQTLRRIHDRIKKEQSTTSINDFLTGSLKDALVLLANQPFLSIFREQQIVKEQDISFVTDDIAIIRPNTVTADKLIRASSNLTANLHFCIISIDQSITDIDGWKEQLIDDKDHILFYELTEEQVFAKRVWSEIQGFSAVSEDNIAEASKRLLTLEWSTSNEELRELLAFLKGLRLSKQQLNELLVLTINECNRIYKDILSVEFKIQKNFSFWQDIEIWLIQTKNHIHQSFYNQVYSEETSYSILKAIALIDQELAQSITATEIANQVNMSRSYFSVCFKNVTSYTFNEYVRLMRMEKAKHYLIYSREKVGKIAEKVGYQDIKYFSKLFRETTGLLPSEYRKLHKGRSSVSRL